MGLTPHFCLRVPFEKAHFDFFFKKGLKRILKIFNHKISTQSRQRHMIDPQLSVNKKSSLV
jgi:hypothetical protein